MRPIFITLSSRVTAHLRSLPVNHLKQSNKIKSLTSWLCFFSCNKTFSKRLKGLPRELIKLGILIICTPCDLLRTRQNLNSLNLVDNVREGKCDCLSLIVLPLALGWTCFPVSGLAMCVLIKTFWLNFQIKGTLRESWKLCMRFCSAKCNSLPVACGNLHNGRTKQKCGNATW